MLKKVETIKKKDTKIGASFRVCFIVFFLVMLLTPIILNAAFYAHIPTSEGLGNKEWIGFWGSYLGGIIGGICTLLTVYFTIVFYERQENNHRNEILQQDKKHQEEINNIEENKYKPILIIHPSGGCGTSGSYAEVYINIRNEGLYSAISIKIDDKYIAILKPSEEKILKIKSESGNYRQCLEVSTESLIGKQYVWQYELHKIDGVTADSGNEQIVSEYRMIRQSTVVEETEE